MKRSLVRVLVVAVPFAGLVAIMMACSVETSRVGAGGECFLASDCEPGLVCVPQRNGARICSNDLTEVAGRPPPEAGARDASEAGDATDEGGDATTDAPVVDAPVDTGADVADAGPG